MTISIDKPAAAAVAATKAPKLRPARHEDHPQMAQLETSHGLSALSPDDWRSLWLDNPLRARVGEDWPVGWVLEDSAGSVVGSLTNIPSLYTFRGRELIAANGGHWVVASEFCGVALSLFGEYFSQEGADLFVNTTVNPISQPLLSQLTTPFPLGDWQGASYWVTGYRGFARSALQIAGVPSFACGPLAWPAAAALRLKEVVGAKSLPAAPAGIVIGEPGGFDASFDSFWHELVAQNPGKLLSVRDGRALTWHFANSIRKGEAWIFTASRNGLLRAYCVLRKRTMKGMQVMRLMDYQTIEDKEDLLPVLLRAALRRCAVEGIDVLEHHGCGLPKMRAFDQFAPYYRKLQAWSSYAHAADPALDAELRNPQVWDPSTYDGDASLT